MSPNDPGEPTDSEVQQRLRELKARRHGAAEPEPAGPPATGPDWRERRAPGEPTKGRAGILQQLLATPRVQLALLALVLALAVVLRFREALHSPILGAEDPYVHMERTWDLLQLVPAESTYPPGFSLLLLPLALLGPDLFLGAVRFLPAILGVVAVFGTYALLQEHIHRTGALAGAFVVAAMPEHVFRTNLLLPTAIDLALLPFLFLFAIRAIDGDRRALWIVIAILAALVLIHPWILAFVVPVLGLVAVLRLPRDYPRPVPLLGVLAVAMLGVAFMVTLVGAWNLPANALANAAERAEALAANPASLFPLPAFVDPIAMFTLPAIVLAGFGVVVAVLRPNKAATLALVWSAFLLPLALVDWFDVWFLPHRTMAYLGIGLGILAALPIAALAERSGIPDTRQAPAGASGTPSGKRLAPGLRAQLLASLRTGPARGASAATAGTGGEAKPLQGVSSDPEPDPAPPAARELAPSREKPPRQVEAFALVGVFLLLMVPQAASVEPWYRLFDERDYEAWDGIARAEPSILVATSWQSAVGYRAVTGELSVFNPSFFRDERIRDVWVEENPGLVVLVDYRAADSNLPTDFLQSWHVVGTWGNRTAYAPP